MLFITQLFISRSTNCISCRLLSLNVSCHAAEDSYIRIGVFGSRLCEPTKRARRLGTWHCALQDCDDRGSDASTKPLCRALSCLRLGALTGRSRPRRLASTQKAAKALPLPTRKGLGVIILLNPSKCGVTVSFCLERSCHSCSNRREATNFRRPSHKHVTGCVCDDLRLKRQDCRRLD